MVDRICSLPKKNSFFLFGARGTGKSTLLQKIYRPQQEEESTLYLDLLDPDLEEVFARNPNHLKELIDELVPKLRSIVIDEIQKVPSLLNVVHSQIEVHKNIQFVMTGSSARKLKRGAANLLGGRAFTFRLHPFTHLEAPNSNDLDEMLQWGTLPKLYEFKTDEDKKRFLRSYALTYLKEEIQLEQIVRNMTSFRQFLEIAAQCNGQILSYSNIASQSNVDEKTVARYFEILSDTMVGHFLEPFNESVRARQSQKPKFFLFDTGIQRSLSQMTELPLSPRTSEYGQLFEQFIVLECLRLNDYLETDYQFFYLRTKDDAEIDLIIRKPGRKTILIEIKSATKIEPQHYRHLLSLSKDIKHEQKIVLCQEMAARRTKDGVRILPWRQGLKEIFRSPS